MIGPDGQIMGKYRKTSIPLVKTASLIGNEKYYFKPGNLGFPVWQTPFGVNVGVMICYDRHFPEHARLLALNGADLVFVPTATGGMSRYLWEIELQAHAIDNIYYVGGVNRVGFDEGGATEQSYYGASFFADPKGKILDQASEEAGRDRLRGDRHGDHRGPPQRVGLLPRSPARDVRRALVVVEARATSGPDEIRPLHWPRFMKTLIAGGTVVTAASTYEADVLVDGGQHRPDRSRSRRRGRRADRRLRQVRPAGRDRRPHPPRHALGGQVRDR